MFLRIILAAAVVFSGSLPMVYGQATIPPGFEVIQLTETPVRDAWPRINNHRQIVYERRTNATDESGEIFLYDDRTGQTIRLTDDNVRDAFPDVNDNGLICWVRFVGPPDRFGPTGEIMLRTPDGVITRLTDNDTQDQAPHINSAGHIAWARETGVGCRNITNRDIFFYDGQTIQQITFDGVPEDVANQSPRLSDRDVIVWVRFDFCVGQSWLDWESKIRMYDNGVITTLTDNTQPRPNSPDINLSGLVVWFHRRPPNGDHEIQLWRNGKTTVLTDWGTNPHLNDAGMVSFIRWHNDTQTWQDWLYRDGMFWQLSDDPFWNTDSSINNAGEVAWRSGPTTTSNIRYMRRFSLADLNCDGSIDAFDIEPFILALFDPDEYRRAHPTCDALLADIDQSGSVDALDIEPFIDLLFP